MEGGGAGLLAWDDFDRLEKNEDIEEGGGSRPQEERGGEGEEREEGGRREAGRRRELDRRERGSSLESRP